MLSSKRFYVESTFFLIKISPLIFCMLILNSCKKNDENIIVDEKSIPITYQNKISVSTALIEPKIFNQQILANGIIEAQQKSDLRFKISDRLASVEVKNGQKVVKGQRLAVLDNTILENQVKKAKIDFEKAKSKLQEEKINFGLSTESNGEIDPNVLNNLKIKSGYFEAENAIENAELLLNQTFLEAPYNGVIANVKVKTGNYITSSDVFCTVIAQHQLEVTFSVLESELALIKKNQSVVITSFVDESKSYRGAVTEINPIVDKNGLIQIKARIKNPNNSLFDGMHVKVIINKSINDVIVIPKEALVLRSNKEVVFTMQNALAKWNYVEVLDENSNSYAIKSGLNTGDTIIVSGNMNLSHDAKVNPTLVQI